MQDALNELLFTANGFRRWVCDEIRQMESDERLSLRGDYVFVIDNEPRFIVFVEQNWCGSVLVKPQCELQSMEGEAGVGVLSGQILSQLLEYDDSVPAGLLIKDEHELEVLVSSAYRVRISTDCSTLKRLLLGTMRARVAYLSGQVSIDGDLPVFLRLVGRLKARGVKPVLLQPSRSSLQEA